MSLRRPVWGMSAGVRSVRTPDAFVVESEGGGACARRSAAAVPFAVLIFVGTGFFGSSLIRSPIAGGCHLVWQPPTLCCASLVVRLRLSLPFRRDRLSEMPPSRWCSTATRVSTGRSGGQCSPSRARAEEDARRCPRARCDDRRRQTTLDVSRCAWRDAAAREARRRRGREPHWPVSRA